MIKIGEKIIVCMLIAVMLIAQIPADQLIYAQSNQMFDVGITEVDNDSKKIEVRDIEEDITKIGLFLNEKNIQTKDVSDDLSFVVYLNGTYEIRGFDAQDEERSEERIQVDSFEDFTVEKDATTHQVKMVSRYDLTQKIVVNKKENVTANKTQIGYYEANYVIPENGEYTFDVVNFAGQEVASKTMKFTDVPNRGSAGDFIISSENDLEQINANPSGTFILDGDIELTSDSLKDVNFTGTLEGKGYMISGFIESLFNSITDATINNIVIKGSLAKTSKNSIITNAGFYVEANDDKKDSAVILESENTTIQHSFAFMNVEGKTVSGFILEGTGTVENSYVSGYLQGKEVYGFGKAIAVKNSYINASLVGEQRILFTNGEMENCFYDAQINDLEELKAVPMYTKDMISGKLDHKEFKEMEGQYPQIKNIEEMKKKAQAVSTLSVQCVKTDSNLSALEGKVETKDTEEIKWDKERNEVSAKNNDSINRFALRKAKVSSVISTGESTTATTTQITYPIEMGNYYKVQKENETEPIAPKSHKAAIESGWQIMYWSGNYKQAGLNWNTNYSVYSADLTKVITLGTKQTNYGKNGGKITLTGTYDVDQEMSATLSGTNTIKGTLYFESAVTLDAPEDQWEERQSAAMAENQTYTVTADEKGKYLRARFVADATTGYQGTVTDATKTIFKEEITEVTIENKTTTMGTYTLNDQLVANMTPVGKENDVIFKWFHENGTESIATGRNYTIKGSDIGKKLFVQAESKTDGNFKGSRESTKTSEVLSIKNTTPTAIGHLKAVSQDDITVTLTMDVAEGLYRYGYRAGSATEGAITPYSILARNKTNTTITGLSANTNYYFYVQQVGENGYTDSEWSGDYTEVKTEREYVKGDVVVTGNTIYNETLSANLTNNVGSQTGQFKWYRLGENGERTGVTANSTTETNKTTYTLVADDIGKKMEVAYEGSGNYAGAVSTITDTISKEEKTAPETNLTVTTHEDTTITVNMPGNITGEHYILGMSNSQTGVPIEQLENGQVKIFTSGDSYQISGLERDTEYFLFIRYAENATHQKSEWITSTSAKMQKTKTKKLTGAIIFAYEATDLIKGQTLRANLEPTDSSFNYKGEWKWTKIASGKETDIANFTLTDTKQGTAYVVPANEATGVTYKVTFTANVGYTGSLNATSTEVKDIIKTQHQKPEASDIVMEAIDDTSIKVKMDKGEGKYRFWYHKESEADNYADTGKDVLANVDIVIDGLDRNTKYSVKVQRLDDDKGSASEFAKSSDKVSDKVVSTKKTEIAGHVSIGGTTRYNETLTATYHNASYASKGMGSDTEGTWQWYRGTTKITGATNAAYKLVQDDINEKLTAKYTMPDTHDFTGNADTASTMIKKAIGISPSITKIENEEVSGKMTMIVTSNVSTSNTNTYYRLQKASMAPPTQVPTTGSSTLSGWQQMQAEMSILKDYNDQALEANTDYTIYFIKTETATEEATALSSQTYKIGMFKQTGLVAFEQPIVSETKAFVVGKTVKAKLTGNNNSSGKWKWYMSTEVYNGTNNAPGATETAKWTEITSGFSQIPNSALSELNLSEDMFAHFIRAEFVAGDESKYSGTITSTESQYVRKIYNEKLTITSSTKGGNGNPKAYANTVITGTIDNYAEKGNLDRAIVSFKVGSAFITAKTIVNGTFTYTMPNSMSYDNQSITAEVSKPKIFRLYVDTSLKEITTENLNSSTSTNTSMQYTFGVPISNADDLENFMKGTDKYTDSKGTYVLTNNIDFSAKPAIVLTSLRTQFAGTLNGDYHTIVKIKNSIFNGIKGESQVKPARVTRMVVSDASMDSTTLNQTDLALLAINAENAELEELFFVNAALTSSQDIGLLVTNVTNIKMQRIGTAHGKLISNSYGKSIGGVICQIRTNSYVKDLFSVNSSMQVESDSATGGIARQIYSKDASSTLKNSFASGTTVSKSTVNPIRGVVATVSGLATASNTFYDKTLFTVSNREDNLGQQEGKETKDMIGTGLEQYFKQESAGVWVYKDGFYPRLKWTVDNNIESATLYSATRAAFKSIDGNTSADALMKGQLMGSVSVPEELQKNGYSYKSTNENILKVTNGGTIIPVGTIGTKAKIEITYTDEKTGARPMADFEFTVGGQVKEMTGVSIVDDSTGGVLSTAPKMGQILKESSSIGKSYQWYRRQSGTTNSQTILGATAKTYAVKPEDVGYEISVLVKANGYASTYSNYTKPVVSVTPNAPAVSNITDYSVGLNANGNSAFKYEFGYMRADQNAMITQIDGVYANNQTITVNKLQRNQQYNFYTRIAAAANGSYSASAWSIATIGITKKTNITGTPRLGTAINNGSVLSLSMETTNGQTGTWTLKRVTAANGETDIAFTSMNNTTEYTLTSEDVGYRIKAIFTGRGNFMETANVYSGVIQKSTVSQPSVPVQVKQADVNIVVKMQEAGTYDIVYATEANGKKITGQNGVSGQAEVTISGLTRNKDYYIFARKSETSSSVASPWSEYLNVKTEQSSVSGEIVKEGTLSVDKSVIFTPPTTENLTGTWKLERMRDSSVTTIAPSQYTVLNNQLTYTIVPKDAGYFLRLTFTANGDYKGMIQATEGSVTNADQVSADTSIGITISDKKDHSFKIQANQGDDTYQFGYRLKGTDVATIKTVDATVSAKTDVLIEGLQRNTEYDIFIRKAAKIGYNAGSWVNTTQTHRTEKSALTGAVEYVKMENETEVVAKVGVAEVNATYKAKYVTGQYDQLTADDTVGQWQWYANGERIEGAASHTYTIAPRVGDYEITVKYHANPDSDFKDFRSASIGTLTKTAFGVPSQLPTVTPVQEDGKIGSELLVVSEEVNDVFYYVQKADNPIVPKTISAENASQGEQKQANHWVKALERHTFSLEANIDYVVYVARLENGSHSSSGVISLRAVRTVKDDLSQIADILITEADDSNWKVLQDKELKINRSEKAVEGVWQYYVSPPKDGGKPNADDTSWQNVTSEVKANSTEGKTETYTFTKVKVPLKYANDYFVKVVFVGRGDLEGSKGHTSDVALSGTHIKGKVELSRENASEVFVPIQAKYIYAIEKGQVIEDEANGIWTWYREISEGSDTYKKIEREDKVGLLDEYTPIGDDVGKKIYAEYTGALEGIYSGSVKSEKLSSIERASQESPAPISVKQISGTSVQIDLPTNMKTNGKTIAQPRLEYCRTGQTDWTNNSAGDAWIKGLKANKEYQVRVLFEGTSEYKQSAYGEIITVKTGNQSFDEGNLNITQPDILGIGNNITATYTGSGYDEGYFIVKRSDGTIIKDNEQGTVTPKALFINGSSSINYELTKEDIGSNIIIQYQAKTDAATYGGFIEKSTKEVSKQMNPTTAEKPTLKPIQYSETTLKVVVDDKNEYVLNNSETVVLGNSSDWQKLTKDDGENHTFTDLNVTTSYVLHVRTAETQTYSYSAETSSEAIKPWVRTEYTITYEGMEGATTVGTNPTTYTELSEEITLLDVTKDGYTFLGWTRGTDTTPAKGLKIPTHSAGAITFTAHWDQIYQLSFNSNHGTGTMVEVPFTKGQEITLPENTFKKQGCTFAKWNTKADGKGTSYGAGATATLEFTENTTLYAIWDMQEPSLFIDVPKELKLAEDKVDKTMASQEDVVKIVDEATTIGWSTYKDIQILTKPSIILSYGEYYYQVDVYNTVGGKHNDESLPLAVLNGTETATQSSKFTLKTPINISKPRGIYKGTMNFIIQFAPQEP